MKQGDVLLTPIPQADGRVKNRPVVYLREMRPFAIVWFVVSALSYIGKFKDLMN